MSAVAVELCEWCRREASGPLRDVQVEPDRRVRDARGDLVTMPGNRVRVGGCCAAVVSRQIQATIDAKAGGAS